MYRLQALNALLQIQQGMEQLRTAAPTLVTNLGLGVGAAAAQPAPPGPAAAPPRAPANNELFSQVTASPTLHSPRGGAG